MTLSINSLNDTLIALLREIYTWASNAYLNEPRIYLPQLQKGSTPFAELFSVGVNHRVRLLEWMTLARYRAIIGRNNR
jgi:hypothetical protein